MIIILYIYGNCRCAHLVAALIGQTPVFSHVYLLISLLFSVVLYKLILMINIISLNVNAVYKTNFAYLCLLNLFQSIFTCSYVAYILV